MAQEFQDAVAPHHPQNMFQAENLSPLELDIFSEAPTSSGNASLGNGTSHNTRGSSGSLSEPPTQKTSAPLAQQQGSNEWTPQNQQQMYQQMHGLPAISTVVRSSVASTRCSHRMCSRFDGRPDMAALGIGVHDSGATRHLACRLMQCNPCAVDHNS